MPYMTDGATVTRKPSARSVYCVSCNGRFFLRFGDPVCPECGMPAGGGDTDVSGFAPTLLLRVSVGGMAGEVDPGDSAFEGPGRGGDDEIDGRLGRSLHVYEFESL
ncbi:MAG TPA: hypothetical protein VF170_05520, partial [Planctomycetaceae bacterium]